RKTLLVAAAHDCRYVLCDAASFSCGVLRGRRRRRAAGHRNPRTISENPHLRLAAEQFQVRRRVEATLLEGRLKGGDQGDWTGRNGGDDRARANALPRFEDYGIRGSGDHPGFQSKFDTAPCENPLRICGERW